MLPLPGQSKQQSAHSSHTQVQDLLGSPRAEILLTIHVTKFEGVIAGPPLEDGIYQQGSFKLLPNDPLASFLGLPHLI